MTNYGIYEEETNLILYLNAKTAQNQTLVLSSRNSTTIAFEIITATLPKGIHTIVVEISQVVNETDISDNTFYGGILITIPGDLSLDGKVDILDAILLANAFGAAPGELNWNPNADINNDDVVNILDAIILASHFGEF